MIKCEILDKEFATELEMFKALKANKATLTAQKKAQIKTKKNTSVLGFMDMKTKAVKGIPDMDDDHIYPIISNTNYLDGHKDVHMNQSMNRTAKNQNGKVYYVADHKLEVDSIIATPKNVEVMLVEMDWKDLGRNYEGKTECLIFKIAKTDIMHEKFMKLIDKGESLQNSIRMQYVTLDMAINSQDSDFEDEYKVYLEVYPTIANKGDFEEIHYFWAVRELKIFMEGSAVLFGSNDATPTKNDIADPPKGTQQEAEELAAKALQESQQTFYKSILN
ncbi:MAG: hypothetical protein CMD31_00155 [Flavobacteriales bacterium]|nr:hypothetical protein [Flavobacteriales bacterium]|tara:strand:+ start:8731 stop:9558 length:828 start_codon:yes stop_codon:yes gene_type:complete